MLLSNWLGTITSRIKKRPTFRSRDRRAIRRRWLTARSNQISTAEIEWRALPHDLSSDPLFVPIVWQLKQPQMPRLWQSPLAQLARWNRCANYLGRCAIYPRHAGEYVGMHSCRFAKQRQLLSVRRVELAIDRDDRLRLRDHSSAGQLPALTQ